MIFTDIKGRSGKSKEIVNMSELRDRLADALAHANLNARELADIAKISPATLSHYKNGRSTKLSAEIAQKIADALGVNVEWLVTGEGNMIKPNIISLDNADSDKLPAGFVQIPEYKICFGAGEAEEPTYEEIQDCVPAYFRSSFFSDRCILSLRRKKTSGSVMKAPILSILLSKLVSKALFVLGRSLWISFIQILSSQSSVTSQDTLQYCVLPKAEARGTPQPRISLSFDRERRKSMALFILWLLVSLLFALGAAAYKKSSFTKSKPQSSYTVLNTLFKYS